VKCQSSVFGLVGIENALTEQGILLINNKLSRTAESWAESLFLTAGEVER